MAIATVGLAVLVENAVLKSPWATNKGFGIAIGPAEILGLDLDPGKYPDRYAALCILVLGLTVLAAANMRRSTSGRRYLGVRVNERGAASIGMSVSEVKLGAFAVSAMIAGLAGL